jgi:hypothetical protein
LNGLFAPDAPVEVLGELLLGAAAAVEDVLPAVVEPQPVAAAPAAARQTEQMMLARFDTALPRIDSPACRTLEITLQWWFDHV